MFTAVGKIRQLKKMFSLPMEQFLPMLFLLPKKHAAHHSLPCGQSVTSLLLNLKVNPWLSWAPLALSLLPEEYISAVV